MELEKVVKERDELNIKIAKWEESSKSLNILLNSQMSAHDKNGLGYGTQLNEISDKSETDSEISMSVFEVRSSNEESTPANDRFFKADGYHAVPPHITWKFLTPRADISFAVKNPVYHSRTKHIEIRHHFIRDCYEKRLIDVIKIHTDANVADLLTKGFDVTRFNFLVVSIGMLNLTSMNLRMDGSCAGSFSHIWSMTVGAELKMANLRYSDKHNMVAFLKKPTESVGFTEIVDFLKGTSLRTLANGIQELVASVDNKEYTITEAYIRSQLQLADATGAAEDQGEGLAITAEPHHTPIDPIPSTSQPSIPSTT
ncbi:hypothetical protein Tco_0978755 [Tanacetum coccineum]|uniref:Uncharacterized protein n=1 Tax=Tanacetum coccineum TaxID=301880 RepID=A0ABQ5EPA6_9ASTR